MTYRPWKSGHYCTELNQEVDLESDVDWMMCPDCGTVFVREPAPDAN